MNTEQLSGNWFDLLAVMVIGFGVLRGRKRGMSEELLGLMQWLTVAVVASLYYEPCAKLAAPYLSVTPTFANMFCYSVILLGTVGLFGALKHLVGEKLVGSELFGRSEFYLGMLAGATRYACILLVGMALVNAPIYSSEELFQTAGKQQANFGKISFPTFGEVQQQVMRKSIAGQLASTHLTEALIKPEATPMQLVAQRDNLRQQREKEVQRATHGK